MSMLLFKKKLDNYDSIIYWINDLYFDNDEHAAELTKLASKDTYDWFLCGIDFGNGHRQYNSVQYEERK